MSTRHVLAGLVVGLGTLAAGSNAGASTPPVADAETVDCATVGDAISTGTETPEEIATFLNVSDEAPDALINSLEPPFTVLVPLNTAFEAIPANVLDMILDDNALVEAIVDYHVIPGAAMSVTELVAAGTADSAIGAPLTFAADGGTVVVNDGAATIICPDLAVGDITLHLIDSVLQPPAGADASTGSSVPGSSVPSSSVPTGFDAEQQAVATAWETAVDSSLTFDEVAPFIEDAEALRATIEAYPAAADVVGGITATVTQVTIDGDSATVLYTVSFAGVEAPYGELEGALVRVDGQWVLPHGEYCAVQSYARNDCAA